MFRTSKYTAGIMEIGRCIVVYGPVCSGKSTVARQVAQSIGVPHIELDAVFWQPGWIKKPLEEFRAEVSALLSRYVDGWVFDGNYSRVRDIILPMADTVVWLRPPFRVAFWRLLKRTIVNCWNRELLWGMNRESWRQEFFSCDSLLLYQVTHWRRYDKIIRRDLKEIMHQASLLELRSSKEVDSFLTSLRELNK